MRKKAYRTLKQQKKRATAHHVGKRYVRSNIEPTTVKLDEDDEEYAKKQMFSVVSWLVGLIVVIACIYGRTILQWFFELK